MTPMKIEHKAEHKAAKDRIIRARTNLLLTQYFWGRLAMMLKMQQTEDVPTLAVDGKRIVYNPNFVMSLSDDLLKSAIAHEIGHCMFNHISRRGGRDPKIWNYAGDYAINLTLEKSGFKIGANWLLDQKYAGMSVDHIYDELKKDNNGGGGFGGTDGTAMGNKGPLCDIQDSSQSPAERTESEMNWKVAVQSAAHEAQKMGKMPGGLERFIEELNNPQVPWREVLARFMNQLAKDDYSWSRPNRRFVAHGLYAPSMYSERMGPIDVVIDTSGSIDQRTLDAFGAEVAAIVSQARPERTRVIYCDAAINHIDEFAPGEDLHFKMHGGGGTDFRPPFSLIEQEGVAPAALVYLTDMYGSFPQPQDFPVLWCATTDVAAPFGETVRIEV
jgi:predicted metal-dependent peptidase